MGEDRPEFGNPKDIAWANATKSQREAMRNSAHGHHGFSSSESTLNPKELELMFEDLTPVNNDAEKKISLQKEDETYPQFTLPIGTIKYSGWYGHEGTEVVGEIQGKKTTVEVLSVERPEKDKGPAPSWRVRETAVNEDGKIIKNEYFVGRRGRDFIMKAPDNI